MIGEEKKVKQTLYFTTLKQENKRLNDRQQEKLKKVELYLLK